MPFDRAAGTWAEFTSAPGVALMIPPPSLADRAVGLLPLIMTLLVAGLIAVDLVSALRGALPDQAARSRRKAAARAARRWAGAGVVVVLVASLTLQDVLVQF